VDARHDGRSRQVDARRRRNKPKKRSNLPIRLQAGIYEPDIG
jgi:hypothetical protein